MRPTRSDKPPEQRCAHELGGGEGRQQEPHRRRTGAEVARVERKQGDDDAEAEKVDGHRGPQHAEPGRKPTTRAAQSRREARPDDRASDMGHSRGQWSRNVKSGASPSRAPGGAGACSGGGGAHLDGLEALRALLHLEFHRLPLFQTAVAVHLDGGVVDEDVFSVRTAR